MNLIVTDNVSANVVIRKSVSSQQLVTFCADTLQLLQQSDSFTNEFWL